MLPLCRWAKLGFDTELIKKECDDTLVRPMLGLCYRVPILTKGSIVNEDTERVTTTGTGPPALEPRRPVVQKAKKQPVVVVETATDIAARGKMERAAAAKDAQVARKA